MILKYRIIKSAFKYFAKFIHLLIKILKNILRKFSKNFRQIIKYTLKICCYQNFYKFLWKLSNNFLIYNFCKFKKIFQNFFYSIFFRVVKIASLPLAKIFDFTMSSLTDVPNVFLIFGFPDKPKCHLINKSQRVNFT